MKSNIFEGAKFGERFLTRDGQIFSYLGKIESLFGHNSCHQGLIENEDLMSYYNDEGKSLYAEFTGSTINASEIDFTQVNCENECSTDIVSHYHESIDEDKLDELAKDYMKKYIDSCKRLNCCYKTDEDVFKDGYRKALENEK